MEKHSSWQKYYYYGYAMEHREWDGCVGLEGPLGAGSSQFQILTPPRVWPNDLRICELIHEDYAGWNVAKLRDVQSNEVEAILSIPLVSNARKDKIMWHYTKNGIYSVKTGYRVAKQAQGLSCDSTSSSGNDCKIWRWMWRLEIPPEVKIFLWKCLKNILPVKCALARRGIGMDTICSRCGGEEETAVHALRDCPWVSFAWKISPLRIETDRHARRGDLADWIVWMAENLNDESHSMFVMLLWSLWRGRNLQIFQGKRVDQIWCLELAASRLEEYTVLNTRLRVPIQRPVEKNEKWEPPNFPAIKINSDASIVAEVGTGMGLILRDHEGQVQGALSKFQTINMAVDEAEAWACREGVQLALAKGIRNVVLELDNMNVVSALARNEKNFSYFGNIIEDIQQLLLDFSSVSFNWVRRSSNCVAHHLARHAFSFSPIESDSGIIPQNISDLIMGEVSHLMH
ncbi:hypothetical protein DH2020_014356 [Rehmannia glutinosa]|uniref:Uncharacterized protein n=1 Tax=Rehmannia glutinosa TaxID=99300 RepID=A0ABR0WXJ9_REHGL